MRITFINGLYLPYGAGGAENTLRLLATELARRGHICSIVTLTPEPNAWVGPTEGIPVHYLPLANVYWPYGGPRPRLLRPLFQAADAFNPIMGGRVRRALRLLRPDVVHCHNLPGFSVSAWVAAASLRIPIVQTIHDYYPGCARSTMWRPGRGNCSSLCPECRIFTTPRRALSWLPDAVTCVSHRVFDRLTDNGAFRRARAGIQPVRIIRGNNPYDFASCLYRAAIPPLTLGFLGRLELPKGLEVLLDAVSQLPLKLLVAGTGKAVYEATLRDRAQAHPNVEFIGRVDPEVFFPRIDLLVIPSVWEVSVPPRLS